MPGIYIHIPFCKQACHYCDFHFSTSLQNKDLMLDSILKEIELRKDYFENGTNTNRHSPEGGNLTPNSIETITALVGVPTNKSTDTIETIYFGGGTPSLLSSDEINRIINQLSNHFQIATDTEITLEANPDNLDKQTLKSLKQTPVNRLSIGIQSFYDDDLKLMNRAHNSDMALRCVPDAADAGFSQITIDLIYALPKLSNEMWIHNLEIAFALPINHLSCYCLTIEPRTALADMVKKNKVIIPDDEQAAQQFQLLVDLSANAGFTQYEISNFCRDNKFSKHNSNYWRGESYLGIGPSAHSYNGVSRQWNVANNNQYIQSINESVVPFNIETLTPNQHYNEYILTSLRTIWGVELSKLETHGEQYKDFFLNHITKKLEEKTVQQHEGIYTLTQKGKLFADKIAADLFI